MNFKTLPKIELHCHLDGSVRPETVIDIAKKENIKLESYNIDTIKEMMIAPEECTCLDEYLMRFELPNIVMQTKEGLRRITFELMEDCAKENVKYIEIRFAPLLHMNKGLSIDEVIESVIQGMKEAEEIYNIYGNIILSCMRTMPVETSYEVIESGKKYLGKGVVAIDLASSENEPFAEKFKEPIKLAKEYGYRITIHAGETPIGRNVLEAIEILDAERIGHGIFIKDCKEAYDLVKKNNTALEMCLTSNIQTKAVNEYKEHPFYDFYKDGINVTVNTDNRTVSDITLSSETEVIFNTFNITMEEYKDIYLNSVEASFATKEVKEKLKEYIM